MNSIEQFKLQALERCNSMLSIICENGRWNRFEDIEAVDQSYYDMYNQEAWNIYIFSNCGLSEQNSKFRKCILGSEQMEECPSTFAAVNELFHFILQMKREYDELISQNDILHSEGSQENIF